MSAKLHNDPLTMEDTFTTREGAPAVSAGTNALVCQKRGTIRQSFTEGTRDVGALVKGAYGVRTVCSAAAKYNTAVTEHTHARTSTK